MTYEEQLLNRLEKSIVIIHFEKGSAGSLLHRIIAHSELFYWHKWYNNKHDHNSLTWLNISDEEDNTNKYTCHVNYSWLDEIKKNIMSQILIIKAIKSNKRIIIKTHEDIVRQLNKNIKIIRIVGDANKLNRIKLRETLAGKFNPSINNLKLDDLSNKFLKPIIEPNTYNLNINNLVDENYDIFKKEYLELCINLNIVPDIKPVRAFILKWVSLQ